MRQKVKKGVIIAASLGMVLTTTPAFAQQPGSQFPLIAQPFQLSPGGGKKLVDPWGKFQIDLPRGALVQSETFNYTLPGAGGETEMWISLTAIPDATSFQTYTQQLSGLLQQGGWQLTGQTTRQVGQFPAQEVTAQINNPQMGGTIQMVAVVIDQLNVVVSVSGSQPDAAQIRSVVDQMLGTLEMAGTPPSGGEGARVEAPSLRTYTNSLGNYSISYPAEWDVEEQPYGVTFTSPQKGEVLVLLIEDEELLAQGPLGIVYALEQQISSQASNYQRISALPTQVGTYSGAKLTYTGICPAGYLEKGILAGLLITPQRGFALIGTAPANVFAQLEEAFNQMVSSFRGSTDMGHESGQSQASSPEVTGVPRLRSLGAAANLASQGEVSDPIGFAFPLPSGWKFTGKVSLTYILKHGTIPGLIRVAPHLVPTFQKVQEEMRNGTMAEGVQFFPQGELEFLGDNMVAGNYQGVWGEEQVRARIIGTSSPSGGGIYVIAVSAPDEFSHELARAGETVAAGLRYFAVDNSELIGYFAGLWIHYTPSSETRTFLAPNGEYYEQYERGHVGQFYNEYGDLTGNWGVAREEEERAQWTIRGNLYEGVIIITYPDGRQTPVIYRIIQERGHFCWGDYLFDGVPYRKEQ